MQPTLKIFGITVQSYGLWAILGLFLAFLFNYFMAKRRKYSLINSCFFALFGITFMLIGAALLFQIVTIPYNSKIFPYIFKDFAYFRKNILVGIVFYGGLIGLFIGGIVYCQAFKENGTIWLYNMIPCIPLFHAFGRVGCAYGGCCYGRIVSHGGIYNIYVDAHCMPIQLYEAIGNIIIFIIVAIYVFIKRTNYNFVPMGIYFVLYGSMRFVLEFYRGDAIRGIWGYFSTSQYISMAIVPLGIYCLVCPKEKNIFNKLFLGNI